MPVIAGAGFLRFSITDDSDLEVALGEMEVSECQAVPGAEAATVIEPDIEASNVLIHIIDRVLAPPTDR